jgi:hypothetical protein
LLHPPTPTLSPSAPFPGMCTVAIILPLHACMHTRTLPERSPARLQSLAVLRCCVPSLPYLVHFPSFVHTHTTTPHHTTPHHTTPWYHTTLYTIPYAPTHTAPTYYCTAPPYFCTAPPTMHAILYHPPPPGAFVATCADVDSIRSSSSPMSDRLERRRRSSMISTNPYCACSCLS